MISIIICSKDPEKLTALKENIVQKTGVPFELVIIDNSKNRFGICKAYNQGGNKARGEFLCFMHEDVLIETNDWGKLVIEHLSRNSTGLIGIAGGDAKSKVPSSWSVPARSCEINITQQSASLIEKVHITGHAVGLSGRPVCLLDGVWLCTRKSVFQQFRFDEDNFPGFHGYDIDYSLQVGTAYDLFVVSDMDIVHYSRGNPNKKWIESAMTMSEKWKAYLPVSIHPLTHTEFKEHHWKSMRVFIDHLFRLKYNAISIYFYFIKYAVGSYFSTRRFISLSKYFCQKLFG